MFVAKKNKKQKTKKKNKNLLTVGKKYPNWDFSNQKPQAYYALFPLSHLA